MPRPSLVALAAIALVATLAGTTLRAAPPDYARRVDAHRAVEQVLWDHRIWPDSNPGPKPPLDSVLPESALRARVDDVLRKSNALAMLWKRPIGHAELQAELDRMRRGSRDPQLLDAMFDALGRDPVLVAEVIARPALVDRLIRSWYANDPRYHDAERREAERAYAAAGTPDGLRRAAASYVTTEWVVSDGDANAGRHPAGAIPIGDADWRDLIDQLARRFPPSGAEEAGNLPVGRVSPLRETSDAYLATVVLSKTATRLRIAVASWPKTSFDLWWSSERSRYSALLPVSEGKESSLGVSLGPVSPGCADDTWQRTGAGAPDSRWAHSAIWTGTEMIIWGGYAGYYVGFYQTNSGGRYAPATDTWSTVSQIGAPSPRWEHVAVWTGSRMFVWGGSDVNTGTLYGDGARYDPVSDTWSAVNLAGAPSPRIPQAAVWAGGRVVIWGDIFAPQGVTGNGGRYDPVADTWTPVSEVDAPFIGSNPDGFRAVSTGSTMVLWPGKRYDPVADTWSPISTSGAPPARGFHCEVWTGSRMIVWGGYSYLSNLHDDGGIYDPVADAWSPMTTTGAPEARSSAACAWVANRMVVWGGSNDGPVPLQTGGRYDLATNTWAPTTTTGAPAPRTGPTAVGTPTEMIVWGGWDNTGGYNTGGRYDPATDAWVPTRVEPPSPEARSQHSAVWTGAELIIWGGSNELGLLSSGGLYFPATNTWDWMDEFYPPSPRVEHTAVWTGTDMLVWGGLDAGGYTNSGKRYDPVNYHWWGYPMTAGAPAARSEHTAVWDGSRMIVWGGTGAAGNLGDGARFDPAADAWSPLSAVGAPSPRGNHSAVWSGSSMIVWGGAGPGGFQPTGARYDPTSDSWSPTSNVGAPAGRRSQLAVWTGTRMLIWGGYNGSPLASGGSYDPAGDAWSAIASSGAPQARFNGSVSWTGEEMIVWGGADGVSYLGSGGRYRPNVDAWRSMTPTGAPRPRAYHTGNWTGGATVIWGGGNGAGAYNDGATYCSCVNWYPDADGDGWGSSAAAESVCDGTHPAGLIARGGDCNDANPAIHPGAADASCNGVDEDCDGSFDEDYLPQPSVCGLGVCRAFGSLDCVGGQIQNSCVPGIPNAPIDDTCNALDDDCDGVVDDDFPRRDDYWTATAVAPISRTNHTAVWSGAEMIVFGGDNGSGSVQTGGAAYAPSTDTWRTLPVGPTKRWHHTAVWADSRMIVWGGDDNVATIYNTGSRYDPATDTWAATTTTGAPTARGQHSAVWTGSRMVIWGGHDGVSFLNTGSRYDPTANTWSATATSGAPSVRRAHTAVWTGTEMIVWGGITTGNAAVNTGARYNPTSNTWAAMATSGAPSARYGHVAMWTGTEMLVWGGTPDGVTFLGNGARYDPATNTWAPLTNLGAPLLRAFAASAWTGTEMILWGGTYRTNETPNTPLGDGARYLSPGDAWSAPLNAQLGPPSARARATAVWTGSEMIVWGGDPNGAALPSGGRYRPRTLCGVGACQQVGLTYCSGTAIAFACTPLAPTPEVCDNVDNNCNGVVDEGILVPSAHPAVFATKLGASGSATYGWGATPDTTNYDAVRGVLATLRSTSGNFTASVDTCIANNTRAESVQDDTTPTPGTGYWYLVRPVNLCSGNGTYDEAVPPQQGLRDAEIAASGSACP